MASSSSSSSSAPAAAKSRFLSSVIEYPDGTGTSTATAAEFEATGIVEKVIVYGNPLSDTMKQEIAMAPEILLPLNLLQQSTHLLPHQHVTNELMKLYNAGEKICVVETPKKFPYDFVVNLRAALDETLPKFMKEKDENGGLRRLKVYFMKED